MNIEAVIGKHIRFGDDEADGEKITVLMMRSASRGMIAAHQGISGNLVAARRYSSTQSLLLPLLLLTVLYCALTMAYESAFPFVARTQLGMSTARDAFGGPTSLMVGGGSRGQVFLWLGCLTGLTPIVLGSTTTVHLAVFAAAAVGASTAAFVTLSHGIIQTLAPDGIRGCVMSANTRHAQGAMAGFNAANGLLMDAPWMTAPILLGSTGIPFCGHHAELSSLLIIPLRALYARGPSAEAPTR